MQMTLLVEAYLTYLNNDDGELRSCPPLPDDPAGVVDIEIIDVFCMYCFFFPFNGLTSTCTDRKRLQLPSSSHDVFPNVTLMRHGFIGTSPLSPSVAISIRTLAVYRQTHRVCPRLSVRAEVRELCHLHAVG